MGAGDACIVIGLSADLAAARQCWPGADIDGELAEQVVGTVAALVARGRPAA